MQTLGARTAKERLGKYQVLLAPARQYGSEKEAKEEGATSACIHTYFDTYSHTCSDINEERCSRATQIARGASKGDRGHGIAYTIKICFFFGKLS